MSILSWLLGDAESKVADASSLTFTELLGMGGTSKTGLTVSELTALRVSVVYACCNVICADIGKLPLKLIQERADDTKELAKRHPVYKLIYRRPNSWQTSMEWRMWMQLHALLGKGAYSYINRSSDGTPVELIPMMPGSVSVTQLADWTVRYEWSSGDGKTILLPQSSVLAIHGLSWNGLTALELIRQGQEAIGLSMAAEQTQARLHGQGARPGGIVTTDKALGKEASDAIKKKFADGYTGVDNAFKTLLLDNGLKFQPWMMNGVDAQHLETRKFQIEEVCRLFRVFPSMIGASDKASTYASAEAFFGAHVNHTLMPWITLWEQAMCRDLLTEDELNSGYQPKFFVQALLRGTAEKRASYYNAGINGGWMTRNEARRFEDMNPLPGLDQVLQPMNMAPAGASPTEDPAAPDDSADPDEE